MFVSLYSGHNQTLEFLGDTILQLIASDYLFRHFPDHHEGHLTVLVWCTLEILKFIVVLYLVNMLIHYVCNNDDNGIWCGMLSYVCFPVSLLLPAHFIPLTLIFDLLTP